MGETQEIRSSTFEFHGENVAKALFSHSPNLES